MATGTLSANANNLAFAVGDGVSATVPLLPSTQTYVAATIEHMFWSGWEGTIELYPWSHTNVLLNSQDFTQASWVVTNLTAAASTATAPDGSLGMTTLTDTTANALHYMYPTSFLTTAPLGSCDTYSVWLKQNSGQRYVQLQIQDGSGSNIVFAVFDLVNGVVALSGVNGAGSKCVAVMTPAPSGGGSYRCSISGIPGSVSAVRQAGLFFCASPGQAGAYIGTGTNSIYIWGAQFEVGAVPLRYIPTTTAPASQLDYTFDNVAGNVTFPSPTVLNAIYSWTGTYEYEQSVLQESLISQYANSPVLLQLIQNMNAYFNPATLLNAFYNNIWNIATAVGYGLDVWGRILGVNRVLLVSTVGYFGIEGTGGAIAASGDSWGGGPTNPAVNPLYSGQTTSGNYALTDPAYRVLLLAKALSNICNGSMPAINQLLINLFLAPVPGRTGNIWCTDNFGMVMTITSSLRPVLTNVEIAIIEQAGVLPKPTGVVTSLVQF